MEYFQETRIYIMCFHHFSVIYTGWVNLKSFTLTYNVNICWRISLCFLSFVHNHRLTGQSKELIYLSHFGFYICDAFAVTVAKLIQKTNIFWSYEYLLEWYSDIQNVSREKELILLSARYICGGHFVIIASADNPAPNDTTPSGGTMVIIISHMFSTKCLSRREFEFISLDQMTSYKTADGISWILTAQIPQCLPQPTVNHFVTKMWTTVQISVTKRYILG